MVRVRFNDAERALLAQSRAEGSVLDWRNGPAWGQRIRITGAMAGDAVGRIYWPAQVLTTRGLCRAGDYVRVYPGTVRALAPAVGGEPGDQAVGRETAVVAGHGQGPATTAAGPEQVMGDAAELQLDLGLDPATAADLQPVVGSRVDGEDLAGLGLTRMSERQLSTYAETVRERPHAPSAAIAEAAHIADEQDRRAAEYRWRLDHPLGEFDAAADWALARIGDEPSRDEAARIITRLRSRLVEIGAGAHADYQRRLDLVEGGQVKTAYYGSRGGPGIQDDETHAQFVYSAVVAAIDDALSGPGNRPDVRAAVEEASGITGELASWTRPRVTHFMAWHARGVVSSAQEAAYASMVERESKDDYAQRNQRLRGLLQAGPTANPDLVLPVGPRAGEIPAGQVPATTAPGPGAAAPSTAADALDGSVMRYRGWFSTPTNRAQVDAAVTSWNGASPDRRQLLRERGVAAPDGYVWTSTHLLAREGAEPVGTGPSGPAADSAVAPGATAGERPDRGVTSAIQNVVDGRVGREGARGEQVRPDGDGLLPDVPARAAGADPAGSGGGVLQPAGQAGGGGDPGPDSRPGGPGRQAGGLPEQGGPADQRPDAGGGAGAGRDGVPAEGAGDRGPGDATGAGAGGDLPAVAAGSVGPVDEPAAPRFRPGGQAGLAPSGQAGRVKANLEALRLLRRLQADGRAATSEQQQVLARWSGWGAIPDAVTEGKVCGYVTAEQQQEIAGLLGGEAFRDAQRNTLNAHYTDAGLVQAIWAGVQRMGFTQGLVLEPGSGSGNFIGYAPPGARMVGVELDPITAGIARLLYPDAQIRNESFGDTRIGEGSFDAVVGNVPFGNYPVTDRRYNRDLAHSIHNHFIIKSLALTRPGGVVALLTSRYTLDAVESAARAQMARYGDLVTAVRLPSGAHRRAAGTDVVTDLLVFRRRGDTDPAGEQAWVATTPITVDGHSVQVNSFFADHPEQVLGTWALRRGAFTSTDLAVVGDRDAGPALAEALTAALQDCVPVTTPGLPDLDARVAGLLEAGTDRHEGHIAVGADGFTQVADGRVVAFAVPATQVEELTALVGLRDLAANLLSAEAASDTDTGRILQLRQGLNDAYDAYAARFGPINRSNWQERTNPRTGATVRVRVPPRQGGFRSDPASAVVYALERYNPDTGVAAKASIFAQRVVAPRRPATHVQTPAEALAVVMDTHGQVVLAQVARLLGTDEATARAQLGQAVFDDPERGELVVAADYLSGNVRRKLAAARAAADEDDAYQVNVTALEQVLPRDLLPGEIDARLGASWIDAATVQAFLVELTGGRVIVEHPGGSLWTVDAPDSGTAATSTWGTERMPIGELAERLLTQRPIEVTDTVIEYDPVAHRETTRQVINLDETEAAQAKAAELQDRFGEWLWEDPARAERLCRIYNDRFNSIVMRTRSAAPRTMPGLTAGFTPHPHQYEAVDGIVCDPATLLDHVVGAGKTAEMIMGAMELRRLGLVRKPCVVVPNHMLRQFANDWLQLYPQAKLLAAGSGDLRGERRRRFVAQAATGDWDGIVLTQKAFEAISMSAGTVQDYVDQQLQALSLTLDRAKAAGMSQRTLKQAQKQLMIREAQILKRLDGPRDDNVSFEQTGIDYLFVDEAHLYKNRFTPSATRGAGIEGSGRASDLDMKLHYLRGRAGSRARVATFATGTTPANSLVEEYVMAGYLRPDLLADAQIDDVDSWIGTFAEAVTDVEVTSDGSGFKTKTRLAKFRNVPELLRMRGMFTDTKTAEDLNLPIPALVGGRPEMVEIDPTPLQARVISTLQEQMETARGGQFLKLFGAGRRAAQDLRLLGHDPAFHDLLGEQVPAGQAGGKLPAVADRIAGIWAQAKDNRYTDPATGGEHPTPGALQIVFMDQGTPLDGPRVTGRWDAYQELKGMLVARGLPEGGIRFVHEARNDQQKDELFAAARDGRIAVLLGSTERMGVGTNVQARAVALHHVDIPWRPADVEQREGRILRQGNQNPAVRVLRYVTRRTFDAYSWQTIERKARFIAQVKRGRLDVREMDDIGDAVGSFAVAKAAASGNPRLMEKAAADEDVKKYRRLHRGFQRGQHALTQRITQQERRISQTRHDVEAYVQALARRVDTTGKAFTATVAQTTYTTRKAAAEALFDHARATLMNPPSSTREVTTQIGTLGGLTLTATYTPTRAIADRYVTYGFADLPSATAVFDLRLPDLKLLDPVGLMSRLENRVKGLDEALARARADIAWWEQDNVSARAELDKPFKYATELAHAETRSSALEALFEAQSVMEGAEGRQDRIRAAQAHLARLDEQDGIDRQAQADAGAFPDHAPVLSAPTGPTATADRVLAADDPSPEAGESARVSPLGRRFPNLPALRAQAEAISDGRVSAKSLVYLSPQGTYAVARQGRGSFQVLVTGVLRKPGTTPAADTRLEAIAYAHYLDAHASTWTDAAGEPLRPDAADLASRLAGASLNGVPVPQGLLALAAQYDRDRGKTAQDSLPIRRWEERNATAEDPSLQTPAPSASATRGPAASQTPASPSPAPERVPAGATVPPTAGEPDVEVPTDTPASIDPPPAAGLPAPSMPAEPEPTQADPEPAQTSPPAPGSQPAEQPGIVIEHTRDGSLAFGIARTDDQAHQALRAGGWKWSARVESAADLGYDGAWYLPRPWRWETRTRRVQRLVAALTQLPRDLRQEQTSHWRVTPNPSAPAATDDSSHPSPPEQTDHEQTAPATTAENQSDPVAPAEPAGDTELGNVDDAATQAATSPADPSPTATTQAEGARVQPQITAGAEPSAEPDGPGQARSADEAQTATANGSPSLPANASGEEPAPSGPDADRAVIVAPLTTPAQAAAWVAQQVGDPAVQADVQVMLARRANPTRSRVDADRALARHPRADLISGLVQLLSAAKAPRPSDWDVGRATNAARRYVTGDPGLPILAVGRRIHLDVADPQTPISGRDLIAGRMPTRNVTGTVMEVRPTSWPGQVYIRLAGDDGQRYFQPAAADAALTPVPTGQDADTTAPTPDRSVTRTPTTSRGTSPADATPHGVPAEHRTTPTEAPVQGTLGLSDEPEPGVPPAREH
ncbi:MAG TPA: helicase-related protein, partial [Kineosporiaceae bacterium]|nr:helicase-related protein [Kineosporiaceae bacterium]